VKAYCPLCSDYTVQMVWKREGDVFWMTCAGGYHDYAMKFEELEKAGESDESIFD